MRHRYRNRHRSEILRNNIVDADGAEYCIRLRVPPATLRYGTWEDITTGGGRRLSRRARRAHRAHRDARKAS